MALLFATGFGLVALASAASATWPLFLTPLPYAGIAWLVVRAARRGNPTDHGSEGRRHRLSPGTPKGQPRARPSDRSSRGQDLNL